MAEQVNANPVRSFVINVITRDVDLIDTIPEFVDNSIDAADSDQDDYSDYWIEIETGANSIIVKDNCGGISKEIAKNYAFRFGREEDANEIPDLDSLIGEFGVGMKRALFKLGDYFLVESRTEENHFIVEVNVPEWKSRDNSDWSFDLMEVDSSDPRAEIEDSVMGTRILAKDLNSSASDSFIDPDFREDLISRLKKIGHQYIQDGLELIIDQEPVQTSPFKLVESNELKPVFKEETLNIDESEIDVRYYLGVADRDEDDDARDDKEAGWHVFCNGRQVLAGNRDEITGWGVQEDEFIPQWHGQYNFFRGVVFIESEDQGVLPWNTTKTGISRESEVWQQIRQEMINLLRSVIDFLNQMENQRRELGDEEENKPQLQQKIMSANLTKISDISERDKFKFPELSDEGEHGSGDEESNEGNDEEDDGSPDSDDETTDDESLPDTNVSNPEEDVLKGAGVDEFRDAADSEDPEAQLIEDAQKIKELENKYVSFAKEERKTRSKRMDDLHSKVGEFEDLLGQEREEKVYQNLMKDEIWLFFGSVYESVDDEVQSWPGGQNDFLMKRGSSEFHDVVELKRPDERLFLSRSPNKISAELKNALCQLAEYLDYYEREFLDVDYRMEQKVLKPSGYLVMGRFEEDVHDKLKMLQSVLSPKVEIKTYDHLLTQARTTLEQLEDG